MKKIYRTSLVGAATVVALAIMNRERFIYYKFTPELWTTVSHNKKGNRYFIAKYLIDHSILIGLSPEKVMSLLGEPEQNRGWMFIYDLGPERGSIFRVDHDWLEVTFEDLHIATSARIRPD